MGGGGFNANAYMARRLQKSQGARPRTSRDIASKTIENQKRTAIVLQRRPD